MYRTWTVLHVAVELESTGKNPERGLHLDRRQSPVQHSAAGLLFLHLRHAAECCSLPESRRRACEGGFSVEELPASHLPTRPASALSSPSLTTARPEKSVVSGSVSHPGRATITDVAGQEGPLQGACVKDDPALKASLAHHHPFCRDRAFTSHPRIAEYWQVDAPKSSTTGLAKASAPALHR